MQPRPSLTVLRVSLGILGVAGLAWAALWAYEVARSFGSEFNPQSPPLGYELRPLAILGCLGVLSSLLGAASALAYAKTASRPWAAGVAAAAVCAVPLFIIWIDVWALAGGCR